MQKKTLPTLYIPHGGGPCFFMDWTIGPADTWDKMEAWFRSLHQNIGTKPKAILMISAHWETEGFKVSNQSNPSLIYDYSGFPEHTYELTYPASGSPELAGDVAELLAKSCLTCEKDPNRGFDHGVFIPLKLMYPQAEIPVACLSINRNLNPALHLQLGKALQPLRNQGVLIIGSGMSYHNMRGFMTKEGKEDSHQFDAWLTKSMELNEEERNQQLTQWELAPKAKACHPRDEHLTPLMVVAGAAGQDRGSCIFTDEVMGVAVSAYKFG